MKYFYVLLILVSSLFSTSYAANSPELLSPQPNTTVDLSNFSGFVVNANDSAARKISIKVWVNDPRTLVYETYKLFNYEWDAVYPVTFSDVTTLLPKQQYLVEVKTQRVDGSMIGQQYFTFFTGTQNAVPLLVSPVETAKWYVCQNERQIINDVITINANNSSARKATVKIYNKQTGQSIGWTAWPDSRSIVIPFANAQEATTNRTIGINLDEKTFSEFDAVFEISTWSANDALLSKKYYTVPVVVRRFYRVLQAKFVSPMDGDTGVSLLPVIRLTRPVETEKPGCDRPVIFDTYEIDRYPADWQGEDYQVKAFGDTTSSWRLPVALKPGVKYQVKVTYRNGGAPFPPLEVSETFTTIARPLSQPLLVSPAPDSTLYLVPFIMSSNGGDVTVNANDSRARYIRIDIFKTSTGEKVNYQRNGGVTYKLLTAETAQENVSAGAFINGFDGTPYAAEVLLTTKDSLGAMIGQSKYNITIKPLPADSTLVVEFIDPVQGQTNVPLRPTIRVREPENISQHQLYIFYGSYEIDRYPADWQGSDYQLDLVLNRGITSWQPAATLQPNTTYQVRVEYLVPGYGSSDKQSILTFTTGPAASTDPLLIWPAGNSSVSLCNVDTLQVNANDANAKKLSVKVWRNDPRQLINEYTYVFDSSSQATQLLHIPNNTQNMLANQQYLIELKTLAGNGSLLKQKYFTLFTTACSSGARLAGNLEPAQTSFAFPNPSATDFQVQLHGGYQNAKLTVIATDGRIVGEQEGQGNSAVLIKTNNLPAGLYLIRISDRTGIREQLKVVKQ
ncbi:T9SS type A sorting domain-containing protein [Cytophagaceae bacterium DM2B3-1]|uniref:T9SS type A sorting domain-containing protein n=1 Tax=Xanthocytophaga flava TaxID=3048013 RepID=A0ABT7CU29_9BACT|nr:T9SS type A sorting domain-containing protein [Xanthocytophaga flavus]MDJ1496447.1 T9SS type A sorting domain-containing protein [Xanthocytophaga flavus]